MEKKMYRGTVSVWEREREKEDEREKTEKREIL